MALIDKASLLMVPSTYEAGKLYNVLPSGNRAPDSTDQNSGYDQTRADFDFDRGTDHGATRIGSDGLIKKYRENLLVQSNDFNTTWSGFNGASGQSGYDGSNDAWRYDSSSSVLRLQQVGITFSGVHTFSFYAKYVDAQWFALQIAGTTNESAWFDIQNGTLGSTSSAVDSSITSVGGGWYRCSVTGSANSQNRVRLYVVGSDGNLSNINASLLIQNAQLESGLVATDVLTSGATTGKAGVLVDLPRINYDANGENGALLLEPSRQNKIQYSEYFGASYWTKSGASVVSGFTSPEGLSNAYKLVEDTSSGTHSFVFPAVSTSSNNTYSIYVKSNGRTKIGFREVQETGYYAAFNLSSNAVIEKSSQVTASIVPLNNGWKRCEINFPVTTSTVMGFYMLSDSYTTGDPLTTTYTGDGSSGVHIFGAQLEAGSYVSSYIPNHGESGGVTRAADSCSVTGVSDVIGQTEGTMFVEAQITKNGRLFLIGTTGNFIELVTTSGGVINAFVYNGSTQANINGSTIFDTGDTIKVAFAYKANDFALYVNGTANGTDTSGAVPSSMAQIIVNDYLSAGYNSANGYKQLALFNERLTNEELATLTTL